MKERELKCLYVNFEHVAEYDQVLAAAGAYTAVTNAGACVLHAECFSMHPPAVLRKMKENHPNSALHGACCCIMPVRMLACAWSCISSDPQALGLTAALWADLARHRRLPGVSIPTWGSDPDGKCVRIPGRLLLPRPCLSQALAQNISEAFYRLEPFMRAAVRSFVRQHLDTYAENEDG